jgi:hypothetical protein
MAAFKKEYFFTPKGTVEPYCYIQKPDYGNDNFKQPRGVYKVNLTVTSKEAQPLIDKIVKLHEVDYAERLAEHKANPPVVQRGKKALAPYEGEYPFVENDDGTVTFKFSSYASYIKDDESIPLTLKVVDAKGKRIPKVPAISGGSTVKLRFSMFAYGWSNVAGSSVKLQLDSVMLIDLVEFASGGEQDWGNETVEGGYVATEAKEANDEEQWNGEGGQDGEAHDPADDF